MNVIPINPTAPRPISEGEANQFELTSYVLIAHTNHCTSCDSVHTHSELFEVWTHPTKTALNKAKILKPTSNLSLELPIDQISNPITNVPVCHECLNWTAGLHPFKNEIQAPLSYTAWADTLQRKAQDLIEVRREAAARQSKPTPTLDQL